MKTTNSREAFPSPLRLVVYLVLIAAMCTLNCLTANASIKPPIETDKSGFVGVAAEVHKAQYSEPTWFVDAYLDIAVMPLYRWYIKIAIKKRRIKPAPSNAIRQYGSPAARPSPEDKLNERNAWKNAHSASNF